MVYKLKKVLPKRVSSRRKTKRCQSIPVNVSIIAHGIGFDVHKDSIVVCVSAQLANNSIVLLKTHSFKHDPVGIQEMCLFLAKYDIQPTYLMECTGVYHLSVHRALIDAFPSSASRIIAMNPLLVHNRISELGNKNDKADAQMLSSLAFYSKILCPSYVGSPAFFSLRDLIRSYHRNLSQVNKFRNRIHRHLHSVNQKFTFDLSTEWSLQLLDHYISKPWSLAECYNSVLKTQQTHKKAKVLERQKDDILRNGSVVLTEEMRFLLQFDLIRLFSAQEANAILLSRADRNVIKDTQLCQHYENLLQIPGFGVITALTVLTEVGDYTRFANSNAFVKFCGVVPSIEQSGEYQKRGHVNRFTNKFLRYILTQAAGRLINRKLRDTDLSDFAYRQRFIRQLPFKKASMKVALKMAKKVYLILIGGESMSMTYELEKRKQKRIQKKIREKHSALDSVHTRALRRDVQSFLVTHSDLLNSTSKYHLVSGFKRLIRKAEYEDSKEEESPVDQEQGEMGKK